MNCEILYAAFGEIGEDILERSEYLKKEKKSARPRWGIAAACLILLISTLLTAEAATGAVSYLLAPLFGMAQTEIVDSIGVPIGVSASVDGYTLTCDAIIGDRYNVEIVYTLSRDNGQPIPEGVGFASGRTAILPGSSGGSSQSRLQHLDDPSKVYFTVKCSYSVPILGRLASASYGQLVCDNGSGGKTVLAYGPWELQYTLRCKDSTRKVTPAQRDVTDLSGKRYRIDKILLSPIGLHIDFKWKEPKSLAVGESLCPNFEVSLKFADGTMYTLKDRNISGHYTEGAKTAALDYSVAFDLPIDLDALQSVIICGREYPIS